MNIIVTGGCGFIGSTLIKHLLNANQNYYIANIDRLAYAGSTTNLETVKSNSRLRFYQKDITDAMEMGKIFAEFQPEVIFNLAAESHVDRSIDAPAQSVMSNVMGTLNLLETSRAYISSLSEECRIKFRFIQVSTAEVFGALDSHSPASTEESAYLPSSPYSASKASANHLVAAWHKTFGVPSIITHAANNYGPFQFPEKMIPLMILKALRGEDLPIYGTGQQLRDWLHVDDHVEALCLIMEKGLVGESYNIGGNKELTNLDVVKRICRILKSNSEALDLAKNDFESRIDFVEDRPGHGFRHALNSSKIFRELAWVASTPFEQGLESTILWYLENEAWWEGILINLHRQGKAQ